MRAGDTEIPYGALVIATGSAPRTLPGPVRPGVVTLRTLDDGRQYVRVTEYVMPFVSLVPAGNTDREGTIFIATPIDNHSHLLFWGFWNEDGPRIEAERQMALGVRDLDDYARVEPGPDWTWGQNRAAMARGHFSGLDQCLLEEDMIVQASMGPVADRTHEMLSTSDVAIVRLRRILIEALRDQEAGKLPRGSARHEQAVGVRDPIDALLDPGVNWQDYARDYEAA